MKHDVFIIAQKIISSNQTNDCKKYINLFVDIFVDNMCIAMGWLWIKSATAPLYVSCCARYVLIFVHSVTL